jgi:hypothetical protein
MTVTFLARESQSRLRLPTGGSLVKIALALLVFLFATAAFAQTPPTTVSAIAPGCGTANTKFDVATNDKQHPFAKPDPGKALIYFLQDDSDFLSHPRPTTRFGIDGHWIGATQSNSYFYISVDPGEHHLCGEWQSFVGFGAAHKSAAAHFTAEPGETYFYIVRNHFNEVRGPGGMSFSPVDSDEAQLLMSKFGFCASRPKKT